MSAVWFDSNTVEMTTAEHYMYLTKLVACMPVLGERAVSCNRFTFEPRNVTVKRSNNKKNVTL